MTLVTLATNHSPGAETSCLSRPGTGDPRHGSRHHPRHRHRDLRHDYHYDNTMDPSDAWDAALSCDGCKAIIKGSAEALAGNEREHDGIRVN